MKPVPICMFCGREKTNERIFIQSAELAVRICDLCVAEAARIIADKRAELEAAAIIGA